MENDKNQPVAVFVGVIFILFFLGVITFFPSSPIVELPGKIVNPSSTIDEDTSDGSFLLLGGLVRVYDIIEGEGKAAKSGDTVSVSYQGSLQDRTIFDESPEGIPFVFVAGGDGVIPGFSAGVLGMRVGGSRLIEIQPEAAYGERGAPPIIPANAVLIFQITLESIN